MERSHSYNLVEELLPFISPNTLSSNQHAITADKQLTLTLYYLKYVGSLTKTANISRMHQIQLEL